MAPIFADSSVARWLLVLVMVAGVYFFIDFLIPVLAALIICVASWPLYQRLLSACGQRRALARADHSRPGDSHGAGLLLRLPGTEGLGRVADGRQRAGHSDTGLGRVPAGHRYLAGRAVANVPGRTPRTGISDSAGGRRAYRQHFALGAGAGQQCLASGADPAVHADHAVLSLPGWHASWTSSANGCCRRAGSVSHA